MVKDELAQRTQMLAHEVHQLRVEAEALAAQSRISTEKHEETAAFLGSQLARVSTMVAPTIESMLAPIIETSRQHQATLIAIQREIEVVRGRPAPDSYVQLDGRQRDLLNFNSSHRGYAAQADLWLNPPLHIVFDPSGPRLGAVNERIAEVPFVLRALAGVPVGARVLDVGACESTMSIALASLGFQVTALDPRPYPFSHPNLTTELSPIESFDPDQRFDAVVLLSTIEHIGVGAYGVDGEYDADVRAMTAVRNLLADDGLLVLTTPFGRAKIDELERTYDPAGIGRLLNGFTVEAVEVVRRTSPTSWEREPDGMEVALDHDVRVVMLSARMTPLSV